MPMQKLFAGNLKFVSQNLKSVRTKFYFCKGVLPQNNPLDTWNAILLGLTKFFSISSMILSQCPKNEKKLMTFGQKFLAIKLFLRLCIMHSWERYCNFSPKSIDSSPVHLPPKSEKQFSRSKLLLKHFFGT